MHSDLSNGRAGRIFRRGMVDSGSGLELAQVIFKRGETDMGDKGKRDKGKREHQKKARLSQKEKRKLKKEKKNN